MLTLEQGKAARSVPLSDAERLAVRGLQLLTMKPLIYAVNVAEGDLGNGGSDNPHVAAMQQQAQQEGSDTVLVSAQVGGWLPWWHPHMPAPELSAQGSMVVLGL